MRSIVEGSEQYYSTIISSSFTPRSLVKGEPVGLTVEGGTHEWVRLVAQLDQIKRSDQPPTLALGFPKVLDVQQSDRIQLLMPDLS